MKRKLAGLGLAFALAELAAAYLPPLAVLPTAAFLILLAIFTRRFPKVCLWVGGAAAGAICFLIFYTQNVAPVLQLAGQTVTCVAEIQTDCTTSYMEGRDRGTLRVTSVDGEVTDFLVYCSSFPPLGAGGTFEGTLTLSALDINRFRMNQYANGVYLQAECEGEYQKLESSDRLTFALYRFRRALVRRLRRALPEPLDEMEAAMLLGDQTWLSDDVKRAFQLAGVSHLLAVSGLHLALLCGVLSFGKSVSSRFNRPLLLLRAALVIGYMILTGMPVSVQRAGFVFLVSLAGYFLVQPPDSLNALGLAAIVLGLICPYAPCDLGFQLSFCGVLGVQLAGAVSRAQHRRLEPFLKRKKILARIFGVCLKFADTIQAAAAATLLTTPILVAHGMTTSGVSILSNLLVVWMLRMALILGIGLLIFDVIAVFPWITLIFQVFLRLWLFVLYALVQLCAMLPMAQLVLPRTYSLFVFLLLGALALLFWKCQALKAFVPVAFGIGMLAVVLGNRMQQGIVRVALVGNSGNPCSVILQDQKAAVLFRGGAANWNAVKDYLWQYGDPEVSFLLDLRQDPSDERTGVERVVYAEDQPYGTTQLTIWDGLTVDLSHGTGGNLAVLDVGGYHIAAMTGNIKLEQPLAVDAYCVAGSYSDQIRTNVLICNSAAPKWLDSVAVHTYVYTGETPCIVVRPHRSMIFEEVRQLAVQ